MTPKSSLVNSSSPSVFATLARTIRLAGDSRTQQVSTLLPQDFLKTPETSPTGEEVEAERLNQTASCSRIALTRTESHGSPFKDGEQPRQPVEGNRNTATASGGHGQEKAAAGALSRTR